MFADGSSTARSIAENTASGTNIGSIVSATDPDNNTLTYTLSGTDASSFSLNSGTGQLQTSSALDYEKKSTYTLTITASDGKGGSASITVTINVTDITENRPPVFADGSSTTRSVDENTASSVNIGSAVTATDPDSDTLTYSLGGTDVTSFSLNSGTGQLQTSAALDYEKKSSYTVTITATDGKGGNASIAVTINVTNVNEAPVFADGSTTTRSVDENMDVGTDVGSVVSATDADDDTITYSVGGTDEDSFRIASSTGQLWAYYSFDYEEKSSYSITVTATDDNGGSSTIDVTINIGDIPEITFTDGSSTTRSVDENTNTDTNIGSAVTATDPDEETLTYTLGGTDAASFNINSGTGQLQTNTALDYETKSSYTVKVTATNESRKTASITVTINVTNLNDNAPVFNDGTSTTRKIGMNPDRNDPIGSPVAATDADGDILTYSKSGDNAYLFALDTKTGQLKMTHHNFTSGVQFTMSVTDGTFTDTIEVTVEVDVTPVFSDGSTATRSIAKNAAVGTNIGSPITAKDPGGVIAHTYEIIFVGEGFLRQINEATFSIDSNTGQLRTKILVYYNVGITYSTFKVKASNTFGGSATIDVEVTVTAAASAPAVQQSPAKTDLLPNYPNPFNPETWIPYHLSKSANVTLVIYNVKGEMVRQLALGHKAAGSYLSRSRAIHWDGKNQFGEKVATGVYFYRFTAGDFSATRKMLIIK